MANRINFSPIRILFLSPWFPNRVHAQEGNFVRSFAKLMAELHTVEVLHVAPDRALRGQQLEVVIRAEKSGRVVTVYYAGGGARVQRLVNRSRAWRKACSCLQLRADLIHAHVLIDGGIMALRLARRWRVPYVVSCHSSRYLEGDSLTRRLVDYPFARRAAAGAYALLPVSTALQEGLRKVGFQANFEVLPNVVDEEIFCPPTSLSPSRTFQLLHLSDGSRQKNLPLLIAAFAAAWAINNTLTLTLAGNIPRALIITLLEPFPEIRPVVHLLGPLQRTEVAAVMARHDLFLLTSTVETQGIVLAEALLCGLPLVTSDCGGPADLGLTEADGTIVSAQNAPAFTQAILHWAAKGPPTLAEREGRNQRYASRFSRSRLQQRLQEIYVEALNHSKEVS